MADSKNTGGLKPLPKPVRPGPPQRRRTQTKQAAPPRSPAPPRQAEPIDPDDFEFRRPQPPVQGQSRYRRVAGGRTSYGRGSYGRPTYGPATRRNAEPTLAEAFVIFVRRMYKRYWPFQEPNETMSRTRYGQDGQPGQDGQAEKYGQPGQRGQTGKYLQPGQRGQRGQAGKYAPPGQRGRYEQSKPSKQRKLRDPQFTRLMGMGVLAAVCVLLVVSIIWSLTNKNAYAVYLDDQLIGHIAYAEDIADTMIQTQAVNRLEASLGAQVQVNETVTLQHVHSSRSEIQPEEAIFDQIYRAFTYKIAATAIYVEGREIAVLKTAQEAEAVAEYLWAPYLLDGVTYVEMDFVEDWELITKLVDQEELNTKDDALIQLDKKERTLVDYIIQDGDTLGGIARRNNTTVEKICADNEGYTATTILRVGKIIKLETTKPYLSVKTVEEITRRESIPMPVKTVENVLEYKNYTKVIQEGQDGEREITVRITRINGIQSGPEETIAAVDTVQPVERIVEVGTSEVTPQHR